MKDLLISIMLMVFSSILAALGQLSLKIGAMRINKNMKLLLKNYVLLTGVLFYGLSAMVGLFAVKDANLTVLYPLASMNYVWISLLSVKFLNETMNVKKWAGIILIILGVMIII